MPFELGLSNLNRIEQPCDASSKVCTNFFNLQLFINNLTLWPIPLPFPKDLNIANSAVESAPAELAAIIASTYALSKWQKIAVEINIEKKQLANGIYNLNIKWEASESFRSSVQRKRQLIAVLQK